MSGILLSTSDQAGPTSRNQPDLPAGTLSSRDGRGLSNVLMVPSSVRMFDWIHGNTAHLRPAVPLHPVLVVGAAGFQDGFVYATAAGYDA